jgi:3-deoxy-D-manno-octulosonic-acid transferase
MLSFYTLLLRMGLILVPLFGGRNDKVKKWLDARGKWKLDLDSFKKSKTLIWFHCASVGEFEQARPVIEKLALTNHYQIAITFFSSSGYEAKANYQFADVITYLPTDLPENVEAFVSKLNPDVAIFVKYEFWFNFMDVLYSRNIPMALISAYFPIKHWTIEWPGILLGERLSQFDVIFTQDDMSFNILASLMINNARKVGDTRVDRVLDVKKDFWQSDSINSFIDEGEHVLVVGSNWIEDDRYLIPVIKNHPKLKVIVVPHELHDDQKSSWKESFKNQMIFIGELESGGFVDQRILYVDRIGLLSKLYRFASVAYIGGGFGKAVHNTLEAAVYNIPVIFGLKNSRFQEIQTLKELGIGIEIKSEPELSQALDKALSDKEYQTLVKNASKEFFQSQRGASDEIVQWIEKASKRK